MLTTRPRRSVQGSNRSVAKEENRAFLTSVLTKITSGTLFFQCKTSTITTSCQLSFINEHLRQECLVISLFPPVKLLVFTTDGIPSSQPCPNSPFPRQLSITNKVFTFLVCLMKQMLALSFSLDVLNTDAENNRHERLCHSAACVVAEDCLGVWQCYFSIPTRQNTETVHHSLFFSIFGHVTNKPELT
jgi:hypothetical protein